MKKSVVAVIVFVWAWVFFGGYGLIASFIKFGSGAVYTLGVVVGIVLLYIGIGINNYNKKY